VQSAPAKPASTESKPGADDRGDELAQDDHPSPAARRGIVDGRAGSTAAQPMRHKPSPSPSHAPVVAPDADAALPRTRLVKSSLDFGRAVRAGHATPARPRMTGTHRTDPQEPRRSGHPRPVDRRVGLQEPAPERADASHAGVGGEPSRSGTLPMPASPARGSGAAGAAATELIASLSDVRPNRPAGAASPRRMR
jgi:hypothetical protein